jgi:hypothetical protein
MDGVYGTGDREEKCVETPNGKNPIEKFGTRRKDNIRI